MFGWFKREEPVVVQRSHEMVSTIISDFEDMTHSLEAALGTAKTELEEVDYKQELLNKEREVIVAAVKKAETVRTNVLTFLGVDETPLG